MASHGGFKGFIDHNVNVVCPTCSTVMDGAANMTGESAPSDGDANVCMYCASLSVYDTSVKGRLRNPSDDELVEFRRDPQIRALQSVIREHLESLDEG